MRAIYDQSVSLEDIQAAINERYEKWPELAHSLVIVWPVEPERFAIQLSEATKRGRKAEFRQRGN
jgi:3-methyladenine DNA glycosylase/8-oxoguanine DNA glycosylase